MSIVCHLALTRRKNNGRQHGRQSSSQAFCFFVATESVVLHELPLPIQWALRHACPMHCMSVRQACPQTEGSTRSASVPASTCPQHGGPLAFVWLGSIPVAELYSCLFPSQRSLGTTKKQPCRILSLAQQGVPEATSHGFLLPATNRSSFQLQWHKHSDRAPKHQEESLQIPFRLRVLRALAPTSSNS